MSITLNRPIYFKPSLTPQNKSTFRPLYLMTHTVFHFYALKNGALCANWTTLMFLLINLFGRLIIVVFCISWWIFFGFCGEIFWSPKGVKDEVKQTRWAQSRSGIRGQWSRIGGPVGPVSSGSGGSVCLVGSGVRAMGLEVGAQRAPRFLVLYISGPVDQFWGEYFLLRLAWAIVCKST